MNIKLLANTTGAFLACELILSISDMLIEA
jgi:hypothetical protein